MVVQPGLRLADLVQPVRIPAVAKAHLAAVPEPEH